MLEYKIRPMAEQDIGIFLDLIKELAESQQSLDKVTATTEGLHNCFFGKRPYADAILAESGGEVIGYGVYLFTNSTYKAKPCLFLEDLYVRPNYRGQGVGKALFLKAVSIAKENDCTQVDWLAFDWNKEAVDFYFSLGAIVRDTIRPYRLDKAAINALLARGK